MEKENSYLILSENKIYGPYLNINPRGFTYDEAVHNINRNNLNSAKLICLDDDICKYGIKDNEHKAILPPKQYIYDLWLQAYLDNNINGFELPIEVKNNSEYIIALTKTLNDYVNALNTIAFVYERNLLNDVKKIVDNILKALNYLVIGEEKLAEDILTEMVGQFLKNDFLVTELDKSYSFRGMAPFVNLQPKMYKDAYKEQYKKMLNKELSFYRARTKDKKSQTKISDLQHMISLPFELKEYAGNERFSKSGEPCLYLGTTSFVCSKECQWNRENEDLFISSFQCNDLGKKLKILNLTVSQALINGIYFRQSNDDAEEERNAQMSMLRIFPLVIAISFRVQNHTPEECRYEYLLSQLLMKVVSKMGIDGIAYLSMQGKDGFQYPQGVNLAIPANDVSETQQFSNCSKYFKLTKPVLYHTKEEIFENKSYINHIYCKYNVFGFENYISKVNIDNQDIFYGETEYAKFDDFLMTQEFFDFY